MNRRNFIKRSTAATLLLSTKELPTLAEDNPLVFPNRGRFERLAISFATINIGLEKPFSVLHISDTHLTAAYDNENEKKQKLRENRTKTFGGRQEEALRDSLAWAKEHTDYVIHTGDLIDWQSKANFDLVKKYFGDTGLSITMGNHEFTTDMWLSEPKEEHTEAYKDNTRKILQEIYPNDISLHSQVVNGVNFVLLDDVYGYVTEEQVERFKSEVNKGLPIVLCMHVPFYTENIWRANTHFWDSKNTHFDSAVIPNASGDFKLQIEEKTTSSFIAYLKKQPLLKAILAGHLHITMEDQFSPTCREYVVGSNFLFHGQEILFI